MEESACRRSRWAGRTWRYQQLGQGLRCSPRAQRAACRGGVARAVAAGLAAELLLGVTALVAAAICAGAAYNVARRRQGLCLAAPLRQPYGGFAEELCFHLSAA